MVATGCQKPQKHGEFGSNIVSSHEFINWYNCPSDFCQNEPKLSDSSNEVILGQGNVAMYVVWILLSKPEMMMASDFSQLVRTLGVDVNSRSVCFDDSERLARLNPFEAISRKFWTNVIWTFCKNQLKHLKTVFQKPLYAIEDSKPPDNVSSSKRYNKAHEKFTFFEHLVCSYSLSSVYLGKWMAKNTGKSGEQ